MRLSAFYHEPEQGYVLRVYESAGETSTAAVTLPRAFTQATKTDFNLQPLGGEMQLTGRTLHLPLRPWEIATVLLT